MLVCGIAERKVGSATATLVNPPLIVFIQVQPAILFVRTEKETRKVNDFWLKSRALKKNIQPFLQITVENQNVELFM